MGGGGGGGEAAAAFVRPHYLRERRRAELPCAGWRPEPPRDGGLTGGFRRVGKLILFGGVDNGRHSNGLHTCDLSRQPRSIRGRLGARLVTASLRGLARRQPHTWTRHAPSAAAAVPPARRLHTAVLCGGRMYVLGGLVPRSRRAAGEVVDRVPSNYSMARFLPAI